MGNREVEGVEFHLFLEFTHTHTFTHKYLTDCRAWNRQQSYQDFT